MRNLKRALSLALAAVMVLGMMVMGASAASINDFADKDEIANQEAVALMVNLGILEGYAGANGQEFGPKNTLQRNAMAKIAYMVATGATDWDMYKLGTPTYKDIDNDWAEGAIEYCANLGYIQGANGYFFPNDTLTVAATATILLRTLGFDNEKQGYGGDQWMINAMRDAKDYGLLNGVSNTVASSPISRDDACQMAYNALFTNVRVPDVDRDMGEYYVKGYEVKPYTLGMSSYNLVKLTATVDDATTLKASGKIGEADVIGADNFVKAENLTITPDMVGSNVTVYAKATYTTDSATGKINSYTVTGLWSDSLVKATNNTKYTLTGPYTAKDGKTTGIEGLVADKVVTLADDVTYYVNGAEETEADTYNGLIGKRGVTVELKDNAGDGKVDTVVITSKAVAQLAADPVITTAKDGSKTINMGAVTGNKAVDIKTVVGYEGLVKGDVVLYVTMGEITYVEKAAVLAEQSVTAISSTDELTIGGKKYAASEITDTNVTAYDTENPDFKGTYNFYLDNAGNLAFAEVVTQGEVEKKYAVTLDFGTIAGSGIGGTSEYQAQLLFDDATTAIVKVNKFGGLTVVDDGAQEGKTVVWNTAIENNKGKFVTYTVDKDGFYALTLVDGAETIAAKTEINKNTAKFDGTNIGNANTIFLVRDAGTESIKAYKGIANVPSITGKDNSNNANSALIGGQVVKGANGMAAYVFLDTNAVDGSKSAPMVVYVADGSKFETTANGTAFDVIINGEAATLTTKSEEVVTKMATIKGLATYVTMDGLLTSIEAIAESDLKSGIKAVAGGVMKVGEVEYQYTEDTVVYLIANGGCSIISADKIPNGEDNADSVYVQTVTGSTEIASVIYVIVAAE